MSPRNACDSPTQVTLERKLFDISQHFWYKYLHRKTRSTFLRHLFLAWSDRFKIFISMTATCQVKDMYLLSILLHVKWPSKDNLWQFWLNFALRIQRTVTYGQSYGCSRDAAARGHSTFQALTKRTSDAPPCFLPKIIQYKQRDHRRQEHFGWVWSWLQTSPWWLTDVQSWLDLSISLYIHFLQQ